MIACCSNFATCFFALHFRHWNLEPYSIGIPELLGSERKCWTLDSGRWILDAGPWTLDAGLWTLDFVRWTLDARLWTLNIGLWTLDAGLWRQDATLNKLGTEHWTLLLTGSEQSQNTVSDSAWLNHWKFIGYPYLYEYLTQMASSA